MGGRHGRIRTGLTTSVKGGTPATDDAAEVRACLQAYADRGVFRGFTEKSQARGQILFRFTWLARSAYDLVYSPGSGLFTFVNVLPNVPARSPLATALRAFVGARAAADVVPHRRIDPRRAEAKASVRNGAMRLQLAARPGHHAYGANRAVNLVHEIYLYLSNYHPEYLWDHYGLPQD